MDTVDLLNYHSWADKMIVGCLKQVSDDDFTSSSKDVRSIRELVNHYISGYDYLGYSSDQLAEREEKLSAMNPEEVLKEISKSHQKFREKALKFDQVMTMKVGNNIPVKLDKDNYLLVFLDHMTYHRGQIIHAVKSRGYKGVNTDYYDYQQDLALNKT